MSVKIIESKCPHCGEPLDAATPTSDPGARPGPGDLSICIRCLNWNKFNDKLMLEPFTQEDRENADEAFLAELDHIQDRLRKAKAQEQL